MSSMPVVKIVANQEEVAAYEKITKPKRLWDNYIEVGTVQKSDKIRYLIAAGVRDGVRYINIREFYKRNKDGEWCPGRDGITIPLRVPVENGTKIITPYDNFVDVLFAAKDIAEKLELADEDYAVYV